MSRTISTDYTKRTLINYRTRSPIRATDWRILARHQNLIWARFVSEWGGHVFDPPFEADANVSPVNQAEADGRDLDELSIGGIVTRPLDSGDYRVGVAAYGAVGVQYDIVNESTGTNVVSNATINSGLSTSYEWRVQAHDLTAAQRGDGSGGIGYLTVSFDGAIESSSTTDQLFQLRAGEIEIVTATEIPTS